MHGQQLFVHAFRNKNDGINLYYKTLLAVTLSKGSQVNLWLKNAHLLHMRHVTKIKVSDCKVNL